MLWNEICGNIPLLEIWLVQKFVQKIYVGLYPFNCNFSQCTDHFPDSTAAVFVINYDLCDHGIIVWRDCIVIVNCCIHTDSVSAWQMQICNPAGTWHKMSLRVFCIDPALHGVTADFYVFLPNA